MMYAHVQHRVLPLNNQDALPTQLNAQSNTNTPRTFGSRHGRPSNVPDTPARRRAVLDAVEIVHDKQSRTCTAFSPYPSPSTSARSTPRDRAQISHSVAEAHASPEPILPPSRTSKYFAHVSGSILTPPSSPVHTLPVYVDSSDFEYPPPERLSDELPEDDHNPTWYDNLGLFEDLMIMLRRLKPILVQESVRDDPWKVLIAVRLLNVTTGKAAIPVFCKIMSRWPTPQDLVHAPQPELVGLLRPLGLYNKRAQWLKDVSQRFLEDQESRTCLSDEHVALQLHYPGVGPYARDSLRIFCSEDEDTWKYVMPQDKELARYLRWRWAVEQCKVWYPDGMGVIGDADVPYLITLVDDLAGHYDEAIGGEGYMYHFCNDLCDVLTARR